MHNDSTQQVLTFPFHHESAAAAAAVVILAAVTAAAAAVTATAAAASVHRHGVEAVALVPSAYLVRVSCAGHVARPLGLLAGLDEGLAVAAATNFALVYPEVQGVFSSTGRLA